MTDPVSPVVVPSWISAAFTAIGVWLAKLVLGRHLKTLDKVVELSEKTHDTVLKIDTRVVRLESFVKRKRK